MTHANAPLTPAGRRRLAIVVVEEGWSLRRAAERFQVSAGTAKRWADRYRAGEPLTDRTSRPAHCPGRLDRRTERRIIGLRTTRRWGPHRIAYHLHLARSTVGRVLTRYLRAPPGRPFRVSAPRHSPGPWAPSPTCGPAPTGPKPTARSNGSTGPCPTNGPTPGPTTTRKTASRHTTHGSTNTTTTDPTPASTASLPPTAYPTSRGRTHQTTR
uniref:Putative transposase n=1 Tax=Propionibacterium freudenreichii TaxID=1744 RepID=Q6E3L0_9ACTN|nr:putative transposase [Propionibacterium freudenreichii]